MRRSQHGQSPRTTSVNLGASLASLAAGIVIDHCGAQLALDRRHHPLSVSALGGLHHPLRAQHLGGRPVAAPAGPLYAPASYASGPTAVGQSRAHGLTWCLPHLAGA